MNLPNKLTILRILLVPMLWIFMLIPGIPYAYLWALGVFMLASLTDLLDGRIARRQGTITDFGRFLDPLADKMLVASVLIALVADGYIGALPVIIILMREFLVTSLRLIAAGEGRVIAANNWGKVKTVCQMATIIALLLLYEPWVAALLPAGFPTQAITTALVWGTVSITMISGGLYLWLNRVLVNHRK